MSRKNRFSGLMGQAQELRRENHEPEEETTNPGEEKPELQSQKKEDDMVQVSFRIPRSLRHALRLYCFQKDIKIGEALQEAVEKWLLNQEKGNQ